MKHIKRHEFDHVYKIMKEAFPQIELRNYKGQLALLDHPHYELYKKELNGAIIAIMGVWEFEKFLFLEHFATDKAARGGGIGKQFLNEMIEKIKKPIILEVELPETAIADRRIKFYERIGFHVNTFAYAQPPLQEHFDETPLLIMSYPMTLSTQELEKVKKILYRHVYDDYQ